MGTVGLTYTTLESQLMLVDHLAGRVINVKKREVICRFGYNDNQKNKSRIKTFLY